MDPNSQGILDLWDGNVPGCSFLGILLATPVPSAVFLFDRKLLLSFLKCAVGNIKWSMVGDGTPLQSLMGKFP